MAIDTDGFNVNWSLKPMISIDRTTDQMDRQNSLSDETQRLLRWSTGLSGLLDDSDGVELFNAFLITGHSAGHLLDFWFACKGFKSNVDPGNRDKLFQVAKVIYRTYIKSGALYGVPLATAVKHEIVQRMSSYHHGYKKLSGVSDSHIDASDIDRCLFDVAQESVLHTLEETYYPEFLNHVSCSSSMEHLRSICSFSNNVAFQQICTDIPKLKSKTKRAQNNSSGNPSPITIGLANGSLVHDNCSLLKCANNIEVSLSSPLSSCRLTNSFTTATDTCSNSVIPTTAVRSSSPLTSKATCVNCPPNNHPPPICCNFDPFERNRVDYPQSKEPPPPHCLYRPFRNSCCSPVANQVLPFYSHTDFPAINTETNGVCALTSTSPTKVNDDNDHSCQDAKSDAINSCVSTTPSKSKYLTDSGATEKVIPRPVPGSQRSRSVAGTKNYCTGLSRINNKLTMRDRTGRDELAASGRDRRNIAETDPAAFAQLLTRRLEKVKESRGKMEKLLSWVNQSEDKHYEHPRYSQFSVGYQFSPTSEGDFKPKRTEQRITSFSPCLDLPSPKYCSPGRIKTSAIDGKVILTIHPDEDAQGILDAHCSRIWADDTDRPMTKSNYHKKVSQTSSDLMTQSAISHGSKFERCRTVSHDVSKHNGHRRRSAVSSGVPVQHHTDAIIVHRGCSQRRRSSARIGAGGNRSKRSEARSTASWDSGVVATCPGADIHADSNDPTSEFETGSIVEAASLQALSSSTTELAIVNSEVTAKLVERMTRRCYQYTYPSNITSDRPSISAPVNKTLAYMVPPGLYPLDPDCRDVFHKRNNTTEHDDIHCYPTEAVTQHLGCCSGCSVAVDQVLKYNWPCTTYSHHPCVPNGATMGWHHSNSGHPICFNSGVIGSHSAFPMPGLRTASDTSSTFDSGISSAYDQLPAVNNDRENRSQSLRHWQNNRHTSMPNSHGIRVPSTPRPQCGGDAVVQIHHHCSQLPQQQQQQRTNPTVPMRLNWLGNPPVPVRGDQTDACRVTKYPDSSMFSYHDQSRKRRTTMGCYQNISHLPDCNVAGGGRLLQHWLRFQASSDASFKSADCHNTDGNYQCVLSTMDHGKDDGGTNESVSNVRKQQHTNNHKRRSGSKAYQSMEPIAVGGTFSLPSDACVNVINKQAPVGSALDQLDLPSADSAVPTGGHLSSGLGPGLIVCYYLCDDPVPYRTVWTGPLHNSNNGRTLSVSQPSDALNMSTTTQSTGTLNLGQFKQLIAKKGIYRYFFKRPSDEFGTGAVHEEYVQDDAELPLWDGKVFARIERAE